MLCCWGVTGGVRLVRTLDGWLVIFRSILRRAYRMTHVRVCRIILILKHSVLSWCCSSLLLLQYDLLRGEKLSSTNIASLNLPWKCHPHSNDTLNVPGLPVWTSNRHSVPQHPVQTYSGRSFCAHPLISSNWLKFSHHRADHVRRRYRVPLASAISELTALLFD